MASQHKSFRFWLALSAAPLSVMAQPAIAQTAAVETAADRDVIVTTGTRRTERSVANTPVPVDVITLEDFRANASDDVQTLLRAAVPSYNVATQPISDDATIVRPANLRGLSPDQTLVLVNGKRRHRGSVITFFGGGVSDGAQGVDISAIPAIALKQVEVLRDGASSQYGSDAIAGVINFVLKDAPSGGEIEVGYGSTYDGDGDNYRLSGNLGLPLGDKGFVNLSAEYGESDGTSRSVIRPDVQEFFEAGNAAAGDFSTITGGFNDDVPQYWGRSDVEDDLKLFVNSALELSPDMEVYFFGNYAERKVGNGFFYRAPTNFFSIYAGPDVDAGTGALNTDGTGVGSLLVGDLDGIGIGGDCPAGIPLTAADGVLPDPTIAAQVASDPNCFSLTQAYPGGFTPRLQGENADYGLSAGLRGIADIGTGLSYDLSVTYGANKTDFSLLNTINPSLGAASPRDFFVGSQRQIETVVNADFAYLVELGLASDLSIAFGAEYREETFEIGQGDAASYAIGPLADQGFDTGANGFAGFAENFDAKQESYAAYIDLEADVTDRLVLQGALRYEDYSAFGDTLDYKIAALFKATDSLNLRATHSTGFHAPTAGQANVRRVTTLIDDGLPVNNARLPLSSSAGQLTADFIESRDGERPTLGTENANSYTLGAAFDLGPTTWTVDLYRIDVEDRIALAEDIDFSDVLAFTAERAGLTLADGLSTGQQISALSSAGILNQSDFVGFENLVNISYFASSFDTRTQGVDVVGRYPFELFGGASELALAGNYNETDVTDRGSVNPIGDDRVASLEDLLPNWKGFASWTHRQGRWRTLLRANYFGGWDDTIFGVPDQGAELLVDAELGFAPRETVELVVGAANIFDNYPDESDGLAPFFGQVYPDFSPSGFVGGQYYAKVRISF